ncbi:MAG: M28 family peptidase [Anaerolineales bacterium]
MPSRRCVGARIGWLACVLAFLLIGCAPSGFSGKRALAHVRQLCDLGPRYVGSEAHDRAGDYIVDKLQDYGWEVSEQRFAYGGELLRNVIATRGSGRPVLLATHYDTRPLAENDPLDTTEPILGANEGGSGVGVLLELARSLDEEEIAGRQVILAFLDGGGRGGIDGWEYGVGANRLARELASDPEGRPEWVVVLDMVGDADQTLFYEWSSSVSLNETIWQVAEDLGYGRQFIARPKHYVMGDHTPFLEQGMPTALLIDYDYPYWHTRQDTLDKISADSLQRVGDVVTALLTNRQQR